MSKKYEIILADFPWPYSSFGTAKLPYQSMSWDRILEFPWGEFTAKRSVIFSWVATSTIFPQQWEAHQHWARQYKWHFSGFPFIWDKTTQDGKPIGATGPRPRLVKPQKEMLTAWSTVPGRTFPLLTEAMCQAVAAPRMGHSVKPPVIRDLIVQLLGDRPRLELFARQDTDGWDQLGTEAKTYREF